MIMSTGCVNISCYWKTFLRFESLPSLRANPLSLSLWMVIVFNTGLQIIVCVICRLLQV